MRHILLIIIILCTASNKVFSQRLPIYLMKEIANVSPLDQSGMGTGKVSFLTEIIEKSDQQYSPFFNSLKETGLAYTDERGEEMCCMAFDSVYKQIYVFDFNNDGKKDVLFDSHDYDNLFNMTLAYVSNQKGHYRLYLPNGSIRSLEYDNDTLKEFVIYTPTCCDDPYYHIRRIRIDYELDTAFTMEYAMFFRSLEEKVSGLDLERASDAMISTDSEFSIYASTRNESSQKQFEEMEPGDYSVKVFETEGKWSFVVLSNTEENTLYHYAGWVRTDLIGR